MNKDEIISELDRLEIEYPEDATKAQLEEIYANSEPEAEPETEPVQYAKPTMKILKRSQFAKLTDAEKGEFVRNNGTVTEG